MKTSSGVIPSIYFDGLAQSPRSSGMCPSPQCHNALNLALCVSSYSRHKPTQRKYLLVPEWRLKLNAIISLIPRISTSI